MTTAAPALNASKSPSRMPNDMKQIIEKITQKARGISNRVRHARFYDLKNATGGMLSPAAYATLYALCHALPDRDIIEVGTATGAGSIAIALAMQESGKRSQLITVERCEGGSRQEVGGYAENLRLIEHNFAQFGVSDRITLYPHELTPERTADLFALLSVHELAAFVHDADGRIDRDFALFWPILQPGGLIVVDDYAEKIKYRPASERYPQGGIKPMLTYRLLNQFMAWGLFETLRFVDGTIFGRKPLNADFECFQPAICQQILAQVEDERCVYLQTHASDSTLAAS